NLINVMDAEETVQKKTENSNAQHRITNVRGVRNTLITKNGVGTM
ncbi:hypothetical protein A3Q56_08592, partial [Intoshia linei]